MLTFFFPYELRVQHDAVCPAVASASVVVVLVVLLEAQLPSEGVPASLFSWPMVLRYDGARAMAVLGWSPSIKV